MKAVMPTSTVLKGLGASDGVGIGKILILSEPRLVAASHAPVSDPQGELLRYRAARDSVRDRIRQAASHIAKELGSGGANILEVHVMLLDDPTLSQEVEERIQTGKRAELAVESVFQSVVDRLKGADNEYLRDRHSDFGHIKLQLILELSGANRLEKLNGNADVIIAARELTPFALVNLPENIKGVALEIGGATSHAAILARALRLPMVLAIADIVSKVEEGAPAMINGGTGQLILHPTPDHLEEQNALLIRALAAKASDLEAASLSAQTRDGRRVHVLANIATLQDLHTFGGCGADGVGLFRTEFLFLHRLTPPNEEEQFEAFKSVAQAFAPREIVIRTVDFGGDKQAPFLTASTEAAVSASLRGIRLCLENPAFFRTHLRAILRAGAFGNIKIMFPMVSGLETFRKARAMVQAAAAELSREKGPISHPVAIGAMVEVPSAALMSGALAREVDFFSIGTNDLLQYALGVERGTPILSNCGIIFPPSVIHLVRLVVESAHKKGRKVAVCGEVAGNPDIIPLLIGMGIDELSMDVARIPAAKRLIRNVLYSECRSLAERVMKLETPSEVGDCLSQAGISLSKGDHVR